jgi:hypothetical protein
MTTKKKTANLRLGAFECIQKIGEKPQYVAWGRVDGHPSVKDGHYVKTSYVLRVDFEKDTLETENTIYTLVSR